MPTGNFGGFAGRVNNGILARQTATSGVVVTVPDAHTASEMGHSRGLGAPTECPLFPR
jgi:hypothetical protein